MRHHLGRGRRGPIIPYGIDGIRFTWRQYGAGFGASFFQLFNLLRRMQPRIIAQFVAPPEHGRQPRMYRFIHEMPWGPCLQIDL